MKVHAMRIILLLICWVGLTGMTPLQEESNETNTQLVAERRRDLDIRDQSGFGWTPLHRAAYEDHVDIAREFLETGADIESKDSDDRTPLHLAAWHGSESVVRLLLEKGAQVNATGFGKTPVHWAAMEGHPKVVTLLLDLGALVDPKDWNGQTPLHVAASGGAFASGHSSQHDEDRWGPVIAMLIKRGADLNVKDKDGLTPLHFAAKEGADAIAHFLLDKGAAVNTVDQEGLTPLHHAVLGQHRKVLSLLLAHGADVNAKNKKGQTVLNLAREKNLTGFIKELRERKVGESTQKGIVAETLEVFTIGGFGVARYVLNPDEYWLTYDRSYQMPDATGGVLVPNGIVVPTSNQKLIRLTRDLVKEQEVASEGWLSTKHQRLIASDSALYFPSGDSFFVYSTALDALGSLPLNEDITGVTVREGFAYLVGWDRTVFDCVSPCPDFGPRGRFLRVDLNDPRNPTVVNRFRGRDVPIAQWIHGNTWFILGGRYMDPDQPDKLVAQSFDLDRIPAEGEKGLQLTVNMPKGWELAGVSPDAPGWAVVRINHDFWLVDVQAEGDHVDFGKYRRVDLGVSNYETKTQRKSRFILGDITPRAGMKQWRDNLFISLGSVMMMVDVSGAPTLRLAADIDRTGILDFDFTVISPS